MSVGCSWHVPGLAPGADPGSEDTPAPVADAGGVGGSGAVDGGAASGDDAGAPGPVASCYSEDYSPGVSLVDLAASFSPQQWKAMSLAALLRRIPGGHALLDTMQDDPQLPNFVDAGSWGALMQSLLTMCHEETHGYDYGHADASDFLFYLRPDSLLYRAAAGHISAQRDPRLHQ